LPIELGEGEWSRRTRKGRCAGVVDLEEVGDAEECHEVDGVVLWVTARLLLPKLEK